MVAFFAKNPTGEPFELFGTAHLAAIAMLVLLNLSFFLLRRNPDDHLRRMVRYAMATILLGNELAWHVWNAAVGQWEIQTMLPLHLCSVFVYLSAYMLYRRSGKIFEYAYFLGIGGAIQAVLTPDLGLYDFPHFRYFQTFISHGLIVSAALYMVIVERMRPTWKSFLRVLVWTNAYMLIVAMINPLIDSNYLFTAHPPETASLIDVLGPWPWYLLSMEAIGFVLFFLMYLPFAIGDWRNRQTGRVVAEQ